MGNDELDRKGARRFAWRTTAPEADDEADPEPPAPEPAERLPVTREQAQEQLRDELEGQCAVLVDQVERAWALEAPAAQLAATVELVATADALGLAPAAMDAFPEACARMVRLILRHFHRLPAESRDQVGSVFLWLPVLDLAEAGELLVQMAGAGMRQLTGGAWLDLQRRELQGAVLLPSHVERLADVIEKAASWPPRLAALELLAVLPSTARAPAAAALRRALRSPHIEARQLALDALVGCKPPRLLAEDVLFLLRDALEHPLADFVGSALVDAAEAYARKLREAIVELRPEGGAPLLVELIDAGRPWGWRDSPRMHPFGVLQPGWALGVLAAAYPDRAVHTIDPLLRSPCADARAAAVVALRGLPLHLAESRLQQAAADAAPSIARAAREAWRACVGSPCPVEIVAGLPLALLDHPPDDVLIARAHVLLGRSEEARAAMVEALFAAAPRRDALILLIAMLSDAPFWKQRLRAGLPKDVDEACQRIVERYGAAGFEGLAWLARRYPGGGFTTSWLVRAADLFGKGLVPVEAHPALRAVAEERVRGGEGDLGAALRVLGRTGASGDLKDRLMLLALTRSDDEWRQGEAARVLVTYADPGLDAAVIEHLERAVEASDRDTFFALSRAAHGRRLPGAIELAERVLARLSARTARSVPIARECARELRDQDRLPEGWVLEGLTHPGEPRFHVAVWLVRDDAPEAERAALRSALRSPSAAVVEDALHTLLFNLLIDPRDPAVPEALRALPLASRARASEGLMFARDPLPDEVLALVGEAFTLPPCEALDDLCGRLFLWKTHAQKAALARVLGRVEDGDARAAIEEHLGDPAGGAPYWQHGDDDGERAPGPVQGWS